MKRVLLAFCFMLHLACGAFAQEAKLMLPIGHTSPTTVAEYSPDGKLILTTADDGVAKIWDSQTGVLLANLDMGESESGDAQFSPDGKKIITVSYSGVTKVWDTNTASLSFDFSLLNKHFSLIKFSPDSKNIAVVSDDSIARIFDIKNGRLIKNLTGHHKNIDRIEYSKDGNLLASTSEDSTIIIWDVKGGSILRKMKNDEIVSSVHFLNSGKQIALFYDNEVTIVNLLKDTVAQHLSKTQRTISKFSPDEKSLLLLLEENIIELNSNGEKVGDKIRFDNKIFNPQDSTFIELSDLTGFARMAEFTHDGKRFVTVGEERIKFWDLSTGRLLYEIKQTVDSVISVKLSPNDASILVSYENGDVKSLDSKTGEVLRIFRGHVNLIEGLAISPNNQSIITYLPAAILKIWDVKTGALRSTQKPFAKFIDYVQSGAFGGEDIRGKYVNDINHLEYSPDGKTLAIAFEHDRTQILDIKTFNTIAKLETISTKFTKYSGDGKRILTYSNSDVPVIVWDVATQKPLFEIEYDEHNPYHVPTGADIYPNGDKLLVHFSRQPAEIWSVETGKLLFKLKSKVYDYSQVVFSANSKKFAVRIGYDTIALFDAETGNLLKQIKVGSSNILDFKFCNNDENLFITLNTTVNVWHLTNGYLEDLRIPLNNIVSSRLSSDNKILVANLADNTCKIWNTTSGKLLYTFFPVDSTDYLVTDPYGRYDGSEGARKLLYFTCGTEVIGLDQVKDQLWVPNLAERIMSGDSINAKKLTDLDICGLTPQVEKEDKPGYHYNITPRRGGLGETVLLINDIEVKRYQPAELTRTTTGYELNLTDQQLSTYLVAGKANPVTVKAYTTANDISSRGVQVIADETAKTAIAPNLYAVMIGVSDYKGPELQLKYAAKDATDISAAVAASAGKLLGKSHVFMYNLTTDPNHYQLPEKTAIKNVFADIGKKASANDILLVFFAGHGVTSGEKKQFYFLTADASQSSAVEAPGLVGVSTAELSDWMKPTNIKAQKRVLILDACNSGQAIKELVNIGAPGQNYIAARSDDKAEQVKAIDKLNERSGLFILAASASNQSAYEMGRYSQGLLTYSLLKAIKQQPDILEDGKYLNVSRWFGATEKTVSDIVHETGNRQEPQIVTAGNFNIGVVDQEVMAGIKLADEMPLFTASNLQNSDADIAADDLHLNVLLDNSLNEISTRGSKNMITYIPGSTSPDAYSLGGRYDVKGDMLTIKVNIRQNNSTKYKFEVSGKKDELKSLASQIVDQTTALLSKNK